MPQSGWSARLGVLVGAGLLTAIAGCASGGSGVLDSGSGGGDSGTMSDGAVRDSGARPDAAVDAGVDAMTGPLCGGEVCAAFFRCVMGSCIEYPPCAGDGTCPGPDDVCRARHCVPGDVDVDGDGSPAADDCDETNPMRAPTIPEVCNGLDEDCDMMPDDGDPATLCESDPEGGICIMGVCGCPPGTFDVDRTVPGCECSASPSVTQGGSCGEAIDLGSLDDGGRMVSVSGNVLPLDREVWYHFRAVDSPDAACDNFHARVQFTTNPGDAYELTVFTGSCGGTVGCADMGFTDWSWATDFSGMEGGRRAGECPCTTGPSSTIALCQDSSMEIFVRVRRRAAAAPSCEQFTLEFSNGLYDT